jgi:hypothetical protein
MDKNKKIMRDEKILIKNTIISMEIIAYIK